MIEILKRKEDGYWSKSDAFLLPLTHIVKHKDFIINSYMYCGKYSIENYELVVRVEYGTKYDEYKQYLKEIIFNKNQKSLIKASFDYEGFSILIYDIAEWFKDIELLLEGKYSQVSNEAKSLIKKYNSFLDGNKRKIYVSIYSCLYPREKEELLGNLTPLEYLVEHYGFDSTEVHRIGEVCSKCDKEQETLVLTGQVDISEVSE